MYWLNRFVVALSFLLVLPMVVSAQTSRDGGISGRLLFDAETGAVVGVVSMGVLKGTRESALTNPSGISYAIPIEHVEPLIARQPRR